MKKPLFNKVCIVGVGLIGGSLGMAIKKGKLAKFVVGVVHRKKTVAEAFRKGALDGATLDLREGVRGADLVVLCGPVSVIMDQLKILSRFLDKKTIVMDVGSSKESINQVAKKYISRNIFVGCHPIAGSEKAGVQFADAALFAKSVCFVTSSNSQVGKLWRALGAQTVLADPKSHDLWAARASHLPHLIAFALFQDFPRPKRSVSNPSIRDFARLSKSDPELWADIIWSNRKQISPLLNRFRGCLGRWSQVLIKGRRSKIASFIREANNRSFYVSS